MASIKHASDDRLQYRVEIWARPAGAEWCEWMPDSHSENLPMALHLAECARRFGAWRMVRVIAVPA